MIYTIISNANPDDVCKRVNKALKSGWKLYGHPYTDKDCYTYQAMVKEQANDKD